MRFEVQSWSSLASRGLWQRNRTISRNQASTRDVSTPWGKENHLSQLRLAARGVPHLQSPAMRPVVRVLPAFAALLVSSAFAQQPTPILPDSRLTPGDTFEVSGQDVCVPR